MSVSFSLPIPRPFVRQQPLDGPDDTALMARFRQGDHTAFNRLFDRYRDRVISYAWRMLRNREEAEEVALEAFCRVVEGAWSPGGSFRAFLFTVAHRLCVDRLRKRQRTVRFVRLWRAAEGASVTPEQSVSSDEQHQVLEEAIASLPEPHRAAVLLYYGQELRSKEVADILNISDQQVRSRLSYARKRLRTLLTLDDDLRED